MQRAEMHKKITIKLCTKPEWQNGQKVQGKSMKQKHSIVGDVPRLHEEWKEISQVSRMVY